MSEPLVERICKVCGRVFVPAPYHVFKRGYGMDKVTYYCGWNCFNKDEPPEKKREANRERAVDQFTLDGKFVATYSSMSEAAFKTGLNVGGISNCCRGRTRRTGKYTFKYKDK